MIIHQLQSLSQDLCPTLYDKSKEGKLFCQRTDILFQAQSNDLWNPLYALVTTTQRL